MSSSRTPGEGRGEQLPLKTPVLDVDVRVYVLNGLETTG